MGSAEDSSIHAPLAGSDSNNAQRCALHIVQNIQSSLLYSILKPELRQQKVFAHTIFQIILVRTSQAFYVRLRFAPVR